MLFFKVLVTVLIVIAAFLASGSLYCAEKPIESEIGSFEGRVSYLNWVASKMIVNGAGVMEFYVPEDIKIRKLGSSIMLADINLLDDVVVVYYVDGSGRNVAINITVKVV